MSDDHCPACGGFVPQKFVRLASTPRRRTIQTSCPNPKCRATLEITLKEG